VEVQVLSSAPKKSYRYSLVYLQHGNLDQRRVVPYHLLDEPHI